MNYKTFFAASLVSFFAWAVVAAALTNHYDCNGITITILCFLLWLLPVVRAIIKLC